MDDLRPFSGACRCNVACAGYLSVQSQHYLMELTLLFCTGFSMALAVARLAAFIAFL